MTILRRKLSDCGFVVIKLRIANEDWLLMRRNSAWKDINFVGGHANERDDSDLERTARRELLEEVPALRSARLFRMEALTRQLEYGPVYSRSAGLDKKYNVKFFLLQFSEPPTDVLRSLQGRTKNVIVRLREALSEHGLSTSGLVRFLDSSVPGGLNAIPYSWKEDLGDKPEIRQFLFQQQGRLLL